MFVTTHQTYQGCQYCSVSYNHTQFFNPFHPIYFPSQSSDPSFPHWRMSCSRVGSTTDYSTDCCQSLRFSRKCTPFSVRSIFCDHLNAFSLQQLRADSLTAWICMRVCRCMHSESQRTVVEWGKAFKQSQEFCGPGLSRKPLCCQSIRPRFKVR